MATINGTTGDDTLNGTDSNDTINAFGGTDTINGFSGDDTIDGGNGNDNINGGDGRDYIHGGAGNDVIHAGDTNNFLFPEYIWDEAGNDTVYGEGGQDWFYGSAGDDYYDGGTGGTQPFESDEALYINALAGVVVDMRLVTGQVFSSGSGDPANIGVDTLVNIEAIFGSNFDDVMTAGDTEMVFAGGLGNDVLTGGIGWDFLNGGDGDDTLTGNGGNDQLLGLDGNDTLNGGEGDDILQGGGGADIIIGGAGSDLADYGDAVGGVTVDLNITIQQTTFGDGKDTLTSIENIYGSSHADHFTGNGAANDLQGNAGNDVLSGGGGTDTLDGGDDADTLSGGGGNDSLTGGIGNDKLDGGAGDDHMTGGVGNDLYFVDTSGDTVTEAAGEGTDTVRSTIGFTLGNNFEVLQLIGNSDIDGTGNALANTRSTAVSSATSILAGPGPTSSFSTTEIRPPTRLRPTRSPTSIQPKATRSIFIRWTRTASMARARTKISHSSETQRSATRRASFATR